MGGMNEGELAKTIQLQLLFLCSHFPAVGRVRPELRLVAVALGRSRLLAPAAAGACCSTRDN